MALTYKRPAAVLEEDDPLTVVDTNPTNLELMEAADSVGGGGWGMGANSSAGNIRLTPAGIRALLNRPLRPKPLLRITCLLCKRTTHDADTYVTSDFLESLVSNVASIVSQFEHLLESWAGRLVKH